MRKIVPVVAFFGNALLCADNGALSTTPEKQHLIEYAASREQAGGILYNLFGYLTVDNQKMSKVYTLVEQMAQKLQIPTPKILIFEGIWLNKIAEHCGVDFKCNTYAMSLTPQLALICIGQDLLQGLSVAELEAVIAHELAHIKHWHTIKKAFAFVVMSWLIDLAKKEVSEENIRVRAAADLGLTMLLSPLLNALLSRIFEKQADLTAASVLKDPLQLAKALEHMHYIFDNKDHFVLDLFMTLRSSHPLTKDRKKYLEEYAQRNSGVAAVA